VVHVLYFLHNTAATGAFGACTVHVENDPNIIFTHKSVLKCKKVRIIRKKFSKILNNFIPLQSERKR